MQDPQDNQTDEVSRSQLRREALAVFDLAEELVALSAAKLKQVPLSDELRAVVDDTRRVTQQIARKRQIQFLAKQMRKREEELDGIRRALDNDRAGSHKETAKLHRLENWRARLVDEGDAALSELLLLCPTADRQRLRQLARQAREDQESGKNPAASRALFQELRALMAALEKGS